MKIISHKQIVDRKISPATCLSWVESAIKIKKQALLPPKISLKPEADSFFNTMPVAISEIGRFGVKVVSRFPGREPALDSQILLYDLKTGECLALMDANWITAMRTGAVAAHSMLRFAKENFSIIGIIGLGNVARATLKVFLAVYHGEVTIKLMKYKDQHELFAKEFADYKNIKFEYCDNYVDTISNSDIVISAATYFGEDICDFDCIKPGALILPVHTRGFTQFDYKFDKIYADDLGHVCHFKNYDKYKFIAEVSDVVLDEAPGRESNEEKIIVYNIGIALHDIFFASKVYELMSDSKTDELSLDPPVEKFWI